jgi:hypothetical protein
MITSHCARTITAAVTRTRPVRETTLEAACAACAARRARRVPERHIMTTITSTPTGRALKKPVWWWRPGLRAVPGESRWWVVAAGRRVWGGSARGGAARSAWWASLSVVPGFWGRSGGQDPGSVNAGETVAGEVARVQRGGAALEPGVVLGGAVVAQLDPPPAVVATWETVRSMLGR